MCSERTAEENRATALTPWHVVDVEVQGDLLLGVRFADATSGRVDLRELVRGERAGVFAVLRDRRTFERVELRHGAVSWADEIDLAPDAMYAAIKRDGVWRLS